MPWLANAVRSPTSRCPPWSGSVAYAARSCTGRLAVCRSQARLSRSPVTRNFTSRQNASHKGAAPRAAPRSNCAATDGWCAVSRYAPAGTVLRATPWRLGSTLNAAVGGCTAVRLGRPARPSRRGNRRAGITHHLNSPGLTRLRITGCTVPPAFADSEPAGPAACSGGAFGGSGQESEEGLRGAGSAGSNSHRGRP